MSSSFHFPPLADRLNFPLLAARQELPAADLLACDNLHFQAGFLGENYQQTVMSPPGLWHEYGDVRWQSESVWIEIDTSPAGYSGASGVLVVRKEIPKDAPAPFEWIAVNSPLADIFRHLRTDSAIEQLHEMLKTESVRTTDADIEGPRDDQPRYTQGYAIYRPRDPIARVATYLDILNQDGIPIPRYRTADIRQQFLGVSRFTLHALFSIRRFILQNKSGASTPQLQSFEPIRRRPDAPQKSWEEYHPLRVLNTRPAIKRLPLPTGLVDGIMPIEPFQETMDARRTEQNFELLAFDRSVLIGPEFVRHGSLLFDGLWV